MRTEIPKTMQAVVLTGHGGLDKLVFHDDWPTPIPEADDVLIHVGACERDGEQSSNSRQATRQETFDLEPAWSASRTIRL